MDKVIVTRSRLHYILNLILADAGKDRRLAESQRERGLVEEAEAYSRIAKVHEELVDDLLALFGSTHGDVAVIPADSKGE